MKLEGAPNGQNKAAHLVLPSFAKTCFFKFFQPSIWKKKMSCFLSAQKRGKRQMAPIICVWIPPKQHRFVSNPGFIMFHCCDASLQGWYMGFLVLPSCSLGECKQCRKKKWHAHFDTQRDSSTKFIKDADLLM